ncbi:MAG: type II toxin-antitoxin system VapB family antitoxin [bacterium]
MKTTLDIPNDLIREAMKLSKSNTKRQAVIMALQEFIRRKTIEEAIAMQGKLEFMADWEKLRHER